MRNVSKLVYLDFYPKSLCLLFALLAFLVSCKKTDLGKYKIEGVLYDSTGVNAMINAKISFTTLEESEGIWNKLVKPKELGYTITDDLGAFEFFYEGNSRFKQGIDVFCFFDSGPSNGGVVIREDLTLNSNERVVLTLKKTIDLELFISNRIGKTDTLFLVPVGYNWFRCKNEGVELVVPLLVDGYQLRVDAYQFNRTFLDSIPSISLEIPWLDKPNSSSKIHWAINKDGLLKSILANPDSSFDKSITGIIHVQHESFPHNQQITLEL